MSVNTPEQPPSGVTDPFGLPWPGKDDPADGPGAFNALAEGVAGNVGTVWSGPAPPDPAGGVQLWWDTTTNTLKVRNAQDQFQATIGIPPIGTPFPWPLNAVPDGFLEFNGQPISAQQYPVLVERYGANLPDYRGLVMMGAGTVPNDPLSRTFTVGQQTGEGSHLLTSAESGQKAISTNVSMTIVGYSGGEIAAEGYFNSDAQGWSLYRKTNPPVEIGASNAPNAHNNLQPGVAVRWITVAA